MINPEKRKKQLAAFDQLLTIMDELREKCPWDKKQTIESLRHLTIEETFELSDAIMDNDLDEISKELGDILLHIVFYARIGDEKNAFDIAKVIEQLNNKLIRRHPHIYGDTAVDNEEEVKQNWEKIKLKEKGNTSVLGGVPKSLPALIKAMRIQEKARGVGFDWEEKHQVWEKVEEELAEFRENFDASGELPVNKEEATKEFGDLMFSLINYSRFIGVNPEEALEKTNRKFIYRFQYLENEAKSSGKTLSEMSLEEMDAYWEAAKSKE
ncbi:nucleoside triphosphate pyrophosphohydrolase [Cyclobacterium amurskyense]|uniref:Nucleoside triphosphate pyrophosphohydrolase n=1 Tax=Cyclobacterium amurskyense TaxID=320787 RepID=A0A0H4P8E2_9BACT|nr:nucleoside triphosphate pyrophosphohydrolase [Cyclobacterium amurskyense]AKP50444.1 Nucleoside triphosphate pyrophosphohydrolase MazG [Cyclobacterium amurskyense]